MATTALFVEIVIAGLQALAWITVLGGLLFGAPVTVAGIKAAATGAKDWVALVTLLALAAAYFVGIVIDRLADNFDMSIHRALTASRLVRDRRGPAAVNVMRLLVMKESEGIGKFVDYQRTRLRVARSTVLNLVLATPVAIIQTACCRELDWRLPLVAVVAVVAIATSIWATEVIRGAYHARLTDAYVMLETKPIDDVVAAAVCVRRGQDGVEVLLVRTTGGKYWTFPKGHIEKDEAECPWKAAEREAREEAGVVGEARKAPLALYHYPAQALDGDRRVDYRVTAFLVETIRQLTCHEPGRDPTWFTPAAACVKVAEGGREERYVRGQQAVVEAAVLAIGERVHEPRRDRDVRP